VRTKNVIKFDEKVGSSMRFAVFKEYCY